MGRGLGLGHSRSTESTRRARRHGLESHESPSPLTPLSPPTSAQGMTALHYAAYKGHQEVVKELIAAKAGLTVSHVSPARSALQSRPAARLSRSAASPGNFASLGRGSIRTPAVRIRGIDGRGGARPGFRPLADRWEWPCGKRVVGHE